MLDAQLKVSKTFSSELEHVVARGGFFNKMLPGVSSALGREAASDGEAESELHEALLVLANASLTVFLPCSALHPPQGAAVSISPQIAQTKLRLKLDALGRLFEQFPALFRPAQRNLAGPA